MATQQFKVVISAEDKATQVIRQVNASVSKMIEPFERFGKSVNMIGRETGIDKIGKSFSEVGRSAAEAANRVTGVAAGIGVLGSASSLAGIVAFSAQWAKSGAALGRTSINVKTAVGDIQALQGAAELAGVSADDMTGSMESFATLMHSAKWGRANEMLPLLEKAGLSLEKIQTNNGNTKENLLTVADSIQKMHAEPQTQKNMASQLGLETLLPLLRKGRSGIEDLSKVAREYGAVMTEEQQKKADDLALSFMHLSVAQQGATNSVMGWVAALNPAITKASELIGKNHDLAGGLELAGIAASGVAATFGAYKALKWVGGMMMARSAAGVAGTVAAGGIAPAVVGGAASGVAAATAGNALRGSVMGAATTGAGAVAGVAALGSMAAMLATPYAVKNLYDRSMKVWDFYQDKDKQESDEAARIKTARESGHMTLDDLFGRRAEKSTRELQEDEPSGIMLDQQHSDVGGSAGNKLGDKNSGTVKIEVDFKNMPRGASLDTKITGNVNLQTNIGHSMPTAVSP